MRVGLINKEIWLGGGEEIEVYVEMGESGEYIVKGGREKKELGRLKRIGLC